MPQRHSQRSGSSQTPERRKSARIASNRILDEITICTTDTARSADGDTSSDVELVYENLTQSQIKARKEPARRKARTPSTSTSSTEPLSGRPLTAGELVVRQQQREREQEQERLQQERLSDSPPIPSTSTGKTNATKTPKKTPAKKTPQKRHPPSWVRNRIKQRNLRLDEIISVVDAEDEVQFIVKWKKLPQPERIGFSDLRQVYPKETLRFLMSRLSVMSKSEFNKLKSAMNRR